MRGQEHFVLCSFVVSFSLFFKEVLVYPRSRADCIIFF